MLAEFIQPGDARWHQMLNRVKHDFYHLPKYIELTAKHEGGIPEAFYAETDNAAFLAPLLIRDVPSGLDAPCGWKDACSPYGYPAPLFETSDSTSSLKHFLQAFCEAGKERNLITVFFRLHPLLQLPEDILADYGTVVRHGQTVSVDLTLPRDELWAQMHRNHRQNIRRLLRAGYQVQMDQWEHLSAFADVYRQTMKRCGAKQFYYFEDEHFIDLQTALAECMHLCTVHSPKGILAAAGLFTEVDGIIQAHLAGTGSAFLPYAPSKLMFHHVTHWAKERGNEILHLGSGVAFAADSLYEFKAGFSSQRHPFCSFRMILDEEKYALLNTRWRTQCTMPDDTQHNFFPEYRQSV